MLWWESCHNIQTSVSNQHVVYLYTLHLYNMSITYISINLEEEMSNVILRCGVRVKHVYYQW